MLKIDDFKSKTFSPTKKFATKQFFTQTDKEN